MVYFSNMVRNDQLINIEYVSDLSYQSKKLLYDSLSNHMWVDYSEKTACMKKSLSIKQKSGSVEEFYDYNLLYELIFLKYYERNKIIKLLDIEPNKRFFIRNKLFTSFFTLETLQDIECVFESVMRTLSIQGTTLGDFSSGQYVKLSFMSKLYWFLNGAKKLAKYNNRQYRQELFSDKEVLPKGGGAIIFIDEGELYYHPEWQRRYIEELLELVNSIEGDSKIQIIISTNSPFMLSDVLQEDIVYLGEREIRKDMDTPMC